MKADILDINGEKTKTIELPRLFSRNIREDLVHRVLEIKKQKQPYSPYFMAGRQYSASGKIKHRRHIWMSGYGRGASRVPRKIMSRRGSQFNWIAAEIPSAVGGRRAHPPKVLSMMNRGKINKKEMKAALESAISATADEKMICRKYDRLRNEKIKGIPFVVESKISSLKTKEFIASIKKILGEKLFEVGIKTKEIRSGRGKRRGRKHKSNAGALIVLGKGEKMRAKIIESKNVGNLGVTDLAKGGLGRLTIYTEKAIKDMEDKK